MDLPTTARPNDDASRRDEDENMKNVSENRPASRRGTRMSSYREHLGRAERTFSRGMSTSSQDSNWRPGSGVARIQGTASRLVSAAANQPRGLSVTVEPPILDSQVNVTDRLITQQGLSSRTRSSTAGLRGPGRRQVLDKRYYEGLLQLKIQELTNEIASLRKETENSNKEREDIMIYDKQNKERAKELTDLQGTLADYNLVMDKLHTGTELRDIDAQYQSLRTANNAEQLKLEQLFKERTQKQQEIHHLEEEIKKERHITEKLMETMSPEMQEKYSALSDKNASLQKTIDAIQQELDTITKEKAFLEQQIASSPLKQEAAKHELKLLELEEKRDHLIAEESDNDPNTLQQKYLNQVKEYNVEIATMERSMNQLTDELKYYQKQLEQVEQDLEECQSERHKKYLELRKREETIESFISTYDETRRQETEAASKLKVEIVQTLSAISQHLLTLPATENEYDLINKELSVIEGSGSHEQKSLYAQYKQKQLYLERVRKLKLKVFQVDKLQALETKLQSEIENLHDRIKKTQSEITIYENLDALKDEAERKRSELLEKKHCYLEIQDAMKNELIRVRQKYEQIQKELQENETHKQLQALERKLIQIEQDNFALKEFIADKKCDMNYDLRKKQALEAIRRYNNDLKNKFKSGL